MSYQSVRYGVGNKVLYPNADILETEERLAVSVFDDLRKEYFVVGYIPRVYRDAIKRGDVFRASTSLRYVIEDIMNTTIFANVL